MKTFMLPQSQSTEISTFDPYQPFKPMIYQTSQHSIAQHPRPSLSTNAPKIKPTPKPLPLLLPSPKKPSKHKPIPTPTSPLHPQHQPPHSHSTTPPPIPYNHPKPTTTIQAHIPQQSNTCTGFGEGCIQCANPSLGMSRNSSPLWDWGGVEVGRAEGRGEVKELKLGWGLEMGGRWRWR